MYEQPRTKKAKAAGYSVPDANTAAYSGYEGNAIGKWWLRFRHYETSPFIHGIFLAKQTINMSQSPLDQTGT